MDERKPNSPNGSQKISLSRKVDKKNNLVRLGQVVLRLEISCFSSRINPSNGENNPRTNGQVGQQHKRLNTDWEIHK